MKRFLPPEPFWWGALAAWCVWGVLFGIRNPSWEMTCRWEWPEYEKPCGVAPFYAKRLPVAFGYGWTDWVARRGSLELYNVVGRKREPRRVLIDYFSEQRIGDQEPPVSIRLNGTPTGADLFVSFEPFGSEWTQATPIEQVRIDSAFAVLDAGSSDHGFAGLARRPRSAWPR